MNKFYKGINDYFYKRIIKEEEIIYYEKDGEIYLTDKYFIAIIPENEFVLDKSRMKEVNLDQFFKKLDLDKYRDVLDWVSKENLIYLYDNENNKVIINKKYMILFSNNRLKINVEKVNDPVLCYDEDKIVGLILPIKEY
jgi:hypothetical protein